MVGFCNARPWFPRTARCLYLLGLCVLITVWGCSTDLALSPSSTDPSSSSRLSGGDGPKDSPENDALGPTDDVLALILDDDDSGDGEVLDDSTDNEPANKSTPSADAGADVRARSGDTVVLDGSDSFDPDGDALTFHWAQDAGDISVVLPNPSTAQIRFVAPVVESETVLVFTLTVSDSLAESVDTVSVFLSPEEFKPPCPAEFDLVAATTSGFAPLNIAFELNASDGSASLDGDIAWTVDGEVVGETNTLNHRFAFAGQYVVEACLTSACGLEIQTRCDAVLIDALELDAPLGGGGGGPPPPPPAGNLVPIAVATAPASAVESTVVTLDGSGSSDPDSSPGALTYVWTQTGGTNVTSDVLFSSTVVQPQFTAPAFANKSVQDTLTFNLVVSDGADNSPSDSVTVVITDSVVLAQNRTADMPDSWLVLYNVNNPDSIAWKDWYIQQWGIPTENTLGLDTDANLERILKQDMIDDIFTPVVNHLNANPALNAKVMGILVGYRVPGNYYTDASTPNLQGGGGWSVSSRLQKLDPSLLGYQRWPLNAHHFNAYSAPDPVRLTKALLADDVFITARIDGPTLADAKALTDRARAISANTSPLPTTESVYIDYDDVGAPGGDDWTVLRFSFEDVDFNIPAWRFPWKFFESDGAGEEATPNCAFRFSYYRLTGWQNADWSGSPTGTRILGYALNSWGATTVRSTTGHSGRYVPNLLFNGGFAGAIGATGEPYLSSSPKTDTVLWSLAEGRTMGEAAFQATPNHAWMWELVGDPLLRVPSWFSGP